MEKKIKVYIASPYTKGDMASNVREQILTGHKLMKLGFCPFIPELYHFVHIVCPIEYDEVLDMCLRWVECCDCVLRLPGESKGADMEVTYALKLGLKVYYSIDELIKSKENIKIDPFTETDFKSLLNSNKFLKISLGWRTPPTGHRESDPETPMLQQEDYALLTNIYVSNSNYWIYKHAVGCIGYQNTLKGENINELKELNKNDVFWTLVK